MALADLAIQMTGWNSVVPDLLERYSCAQHNFLYCTIMFRFHRNNTSVLLDVLIVLPEEVLACVCIDATSKVCLRSIIELCAWDKIEEESFVMNLGDIIRMC